MDDAATRDPRFTARVARARFRALDANAPTTSDSVFPYEAAWCVRCVRRTGILLFCVGCLTVVVTSISLGSPQRAAAASDVANGQVVPMPPRAPPHMPPPMPTPSTYQPLAPQRQPWPQQPPPPCLPPPPLLHLSSRSPPSPHPNVPAPSSTFKLSPPPWTPIRHVRPINTLTGSAFCAEHWFRTGLDACRRCTGAAGPTPSHFRNGTRRPHLLYLHIQKTGGSSIECATEGHRMVDDLLWTNLGHMRNAWGGHVDACRAECTFNGMAPKVVVSVRDPYG